MDAFSKYSIDNWVNENKENGRTHAQGLLKIFGSQYYNVDIVVLRSYVFLHGK